MLIEIQPCLFFINMMSLITWYVFKEWKTSKTLHDSAVTISSWVRTLFDSDLLKYFVNQTVNKITRWVSHLEYYSQKFCSEEGYERELLSIFIKF